MKIILRLDDVTPEHIHETVFINGANCGQLCFRHGEYQTFVAALMLGAKHMTQSWPPDAGSLLEIDNDPIGWDKNGDFCMPNDKRCVAKYTNKEPANG